MTNSNMNVGLELNKGSAMVAAVSSAVGAGYFCYVFDIFDPLLASLCGLAAGFGVGYVSAKNGAIMILLSVGAFVVANVSDHDRTTSDAYPLAFKNNSGHDVELHLRAVVKKNYAVFTWNIKNGSFTYLDIRDARAKLYNPVVFYECRATDGSTIPQGSYKFQSGDKRPYMMHRAELELQGQESEQYYLLPGCW